MSRTKLPHEKRLYWGGELSYLLILWLNATQETDRNRRVVLLLERIAEYFAAVGRNLSSSDTGHPGTLWWEGRVIKGGARAEYPSENDDVNRAANAVKAAFLSYVVHPELAYGYGDRLLFDFTPAKSRWLETADRIGGPSKAETYFVFTETHAVTRIIELCQEGLIDRVRKCRCGACVLRKAFTLKIPLGRLSAEGLPGQPGPEGHIAVST